MDAVDSTGEGQGFATDLRFRLNGVDHVLHHVDPTMLLVDWLRSGAVGLTGTKKGCAQGGCGACTVMLSRWTVGLDDIEHLAVNACLRPLCAIDGMEVTTTEGTGSCRTELSPVQYRIAKDNGSQCGFCTPGFVMNMHAFLVANRDRPILQKEIEAAFDGNLCRCTGYRAILYGMRHFASDWSPADEEGCLQTQVDPAEEVPPQPLLVPQGPLRQPPRALHCRGEHHEWFRVTSLAQVHEILSRHPNPADVKLVGGNTGIGIYDRFVEDPRILVDISQLPELHGIEAREDGIVLGAATTYGTLLATLDGWIASGATPPQRLAGLRALRYMAERTAGTVVRNAATLAGNTMLVVRHVAGGEPFPSDLFTALASLDARIHVSVADDTLVMPLLAFAADYASSPRLQQGVILRYDVPWTGMREYVRTYKVALREVNAHSIVNGGLRVRLGEDRTVAEAAVVLGGIGPLAFRCTALEAYLSGKAWDAATLAAALPILRHEVEETFARNRERMSGLVDEGFTDAYRTHLAESFLYQFFIHILEEIAPDSVPSILRSAGLRPERPLSSGRQKYEADPSEYPVGLPLIKLGAFLQASGEACYTHDIPLPMRGLQSAVVTSARALATFSYCIPAPGGAHPTDLDGLIDYLRGRSAHFFDYVTARDIPAKGRNGVSNSNRDYADPIFADGYVTSYGQCIGLVLATEEAAAIEIAAFISTSCIAYADAGQPILGISEAVEAGSIFPDAPPYPVHIWKISRPGGDFAWTAAAGDAVVHGYPCKVVTGRQESGSQLHFYMETHSCLAVPAAGNEIVVHPSSQSPDGVHGGIQKTLNIPASHIGVRIDRVGGGYGGKTTRSPWVASATAVAAWKHSRAVRLAVRRENDSAMIGHRHPLRGDYAVAIATGADNPDHMGRLMGISTDFLSDGGATYDCSFVVMDCIQLRSDSAYMVPNFRTSGDVCRTNTASNGAMRSMGLIQAILVQEDAIEQAAYSIGMLPEDVRGKNLYQQGQLTPFGQVVDYCYLDAVWAHIGRTSEFERRRTEVDAFNAANRWKKRGISMIPVKYGSGYNLASLEQAGALIDVFDQDGTVLIRHGGVEMGQGILTKIAQIAALELNLPISLIETSGTDTQIVPNPVGTGASTGTAFNGGAVRAACLVLRQRLEEYCLTLLQAHGPAWCHSKGIDFWSYEKGWQGGTTTANGIPSIWLNIVKMAYNARIDLSAQVRFAQAGGEAADSGLIFRPGAEEAVDHFTGFTFSAACTEVEIDVLTGETTVLRADLLYDMGQSMNPAIDIGQVEGAFVQGLGYVLTEEVVFQPDGPNRGRLNTDNTWYYKVPATTTIPLIFNVELFPVSEAANGEANPYELFSSKEVGEPPLVLAATAYFAVKHAILAARQDRGRNQWFFLPAPATVQRIREACLVEAADLTLV